MKTFLLAVFLLLLFQHLLAFRVLPCIWNRYSISRNCRFAQKYTYANSPPSYFSAADDLQKVYNEETKKRGWGYRRKKQDTSVSLETSKMPGRVKGVLEWKKRWHLNADDHLIQNRPLFHRVVSEFAETMYEAKMSPFHYGQEVNGTVIHVDDDHAVVLVKPFLEINIPLREVSLNFTGSSSEKGFTMHMFLREGQKLSCFAIGKLRGRVIGTLRPYLYLDAWKKVQEYYRQDTTVDGYIRGKSSKRILVSVEGIVGYLGTQNLVVEPSSLLIGRRIRVRFSII
jgi:hypothetical protein